MRKPSSVAHTGSAAPAAAGIQKKASSQSGLQGSIKGAAWEFRDAELYVMKNSYLGVGDETFRYAQFDLRLYGKHPHKNFRIHVNGPVGSLPYGREYVRRGENPFDSVVGEGVPMDLVNVQIDGARGPHSNMQTRGLRGVLAYGQIAGGQVPVRIDLHADQIGVQIKGRFEATVLDL